MVIISADFNPQRDDAKENDILTKPCFSAKFTRSFKAIFVYE